MNQKPRIVFIHYRTGERDGVSLEIEKRAKIFSQELGCEIFYITGYDGLGRKNAFVIPEMDIKNNFSKFFRENCFESRVIGEEMSIALYAQQEQKIIKQLYSHLQYIQPTLIFVHNIFSLSYHLPATTALLTALDHIEIPTVAVHHDFWFEREKFLHPKFSFIKTIMTNLPPRRSYIFEHQVINSLANDQLFKRRHITPIQTGDYFDFSRPLPQPDPVTKQLRKDFFIKEDDLLILHATRITERKAIENAILFAAHLIAELKRNIPLSIPGRTLTKNSSVVILLPNFIEADALSYVKALQGFAQEKNIRLIWASDSFALERTQKENRQIYSFWDSYLACDLITYTSILEGFGNQLLEAIYFEKPIVLFEYPVFLKDLQSKGYQYISLGNKYWVRNTLHLISEKAARDAAQKTIKLFTNQKEVATMIQTNKDIATKTRDVHILSSELRSLLSRVIHES